jgi:hypothetical protein
MKGSAMMVFVAFLSKYHFVVAALLLVTVAFMAGCGGEPEPLTEEGLKNAEYHGIYDGPVDLTEGKYEGEPFVEGGASRPVVVFIEPYAFGDLDGDGVDDAAVLLVETSGGSGSFVYLAAVLNKNGKAVNEATTLLGDRAQVGELAIEDGQIHVKLLTHGPEDPMCCPSQESSETYTLEGNELVPEGG